MSRVLGAMLVAICAVGLGTTACGGSSAPSTATATSAIATPGPAPTVVLTPHERRVWAPLPPNRSRIPVLLYHGIGPESDFSHPDDAAYGIGKDDFAKQMTMMHHAGYRTISLPTFLRFVEGKTVDLPPRPLLLTFDDARRDSWTGGDGILRKLGYTAVMFVDVGRIEDRNPEYMTWKELQAAQRSGRWDLQLHSGHGHMFIRYGPHPNDTGPYYAYRKPDEDFAAWQKRVRSDIEWGQRTLADHISAYTPLAFAPPFGAYGQEGTNDPRIPQNLLAWLTGRFGTVFTQDQNALASPGKMQPLGRIQVTRGETGGDVHEALLTGTLTGARSGE